MCQTPGVFIILSTEGSYSQTPELHYRFRIRSAVAECGRCMQLVTLFLYIVDFENGTPHLKRSVQMIEVTINLKCNNTENVTMGSSWCSS